MGSIDLVSANIIHGDSRKMSELSDGAVNLVVTSPPYYDLKNYESSNREGGQLGSPANFEEYVANLNLVWDEAIRVLAPDGKLCINIMPIFLSGEETGMGRRSTRTMLSEIESYLVSRGDMFLLSLFIWDKRKIVRFSSFGSYPYPPNIFSTFPYEWIMVFSKKGKRAPVPKEIKERSRISTQDWQNWAVNSIWEMQPARAKTVGHPAPFPDELPARLIKLYSFVGDTVLDPFAGSGTTVRVARQLGRNGVGYEISPEYVDLARTALGSELDFTADG